MQLGRKEGRMNDLISRKDAIDSPVKMVSEGLEWIPVYHIKELPSAQETHEERTETHACDLIDRQAAMEEISKQQTYKMFEGEDTLYLDANDVGSVLASLPSAEPERKTAEWIYGENGGQDGWYCSKCGLFIPWDYEYYGLDNIDFIADFHTCPKCDRKMLKYTGMRGKQE